MGNMLHHGRGRPIDETYSLIGLLESFSYTFGKNYQSLFTKSFTKSPTRTAVITIRLPVETVIKSQGTKLGNIAISYKL